jgi:hypothetical protein
MKTIILKKYNLRILVSLAVLFSRCSNFTEVELPSSQLSSAAVFENKTTANAAMTDIYSKIRDKGLLTGNATGLYRQLGLYTDELQYYGLAGTSQANFFNNSLLPSGSEITELWNSSYNQIYAANAVIEGVKRSLALSDIDKAQLKGEALFVRALIHFHLVNCFGPIPFITETDYRKNSALSRSPEKTVNQLIKKDLEQAIGLLPVNYVNTDRVRPNRATALALLARLCLYMELWEEASNNASAVLNQTDLYVWPTALDEIFLKESRSTIWQFSPSIAGRNTYEGANLIFVQGPPPSVAIKDDLLMAFSANDLRKTQWIKTVTNGTSTWYHPYKYKRQTTTSSSVEYSIVFRIAEQYLIRAEARAHSGDLVGAKQDLNKTRNLAGLQNTTAVTEPEIIDDVLIERRLEFFTEFGHRFFDLKRTKRLDGVLLKVKPQWKSTNRLLPLPENEILLNSNLEPQNEGY